MLADCPTGGVLITHTPPFGIADIQKDGSHEGSRAIHQGIMRCRPRLNLCGHIQNAWGMTGSLGQTSVHNLGPEINWFDI